MQEAMAAGGDLQSVMLDRDELSRLGLRTEDHCGRFYQMLFVYSYGLHHSLQELLGVAAESHRAELAVRFWRTFVGIAERLLKAGIHTELLELLHGMETEVSDLTAESAAREQRNEAEVTELRVVAAAAVKVRVAHVAVGAAPAAAPASVSANRPKRAARKPELFEAGSCTELTRLMAQAPHSLT